MTNIIVKESHSLGEKYYTFKHSSGLTVYVFPKEMSSSYALFATRYGAIDNKFKLEGEEEFTCVPDGIAHFLEHKMFECENGVDAFELFSRTGASANAYTSNTRTAYLFSATENFYESLEYLLDFVTHPYFTEQTVQKEQGIIGQELKMYDDHPMARLEKGLLQALYKKNKIRIDVGGTIESIAQINADLLYKCYNTFYSLHNMVLALCGNVDVDEVLKICDKLLMPTEEKKIIRDYECDDEPYEVYNTRSTCSLSVSKPIFAIGVKINEIPDDPNERLKQFYAMSILNEMLYSRSSEMYNELYDKNLITGPISSSVEQFNSYFFNEIYSESGDPEAVYDYFVSYINDKKKNGLSIEAFELAKRTLYADNIMMYDSVDDIADALVTNYLEETELFENSDIIASITFDYVEKMLHSAYDERCYAMSVVNPIEKEEK
jgi:predicted Zn-dependent peptidase